MNRKTGPKNHIRLLYWVYCNTDLGFTIALIGVENQAAIDYSMIVRTMLYDALS